MTLSGGHLPCIADGIYNKTIVSWRRTVSVKFTEKSDLPAVAAFPIAIILSVLSTFRGLFMSHVNGLLRYGYPLIAATPLICGYTVYGRIAGAGGGGRGAHRARADKNGTAVRLRGSPEAGLRQGDTAHKEQDPGYLLLRSEPNGG